MNWFKRKKRESGDQDIRESDIRISGDQCNARCAASRDLLFINDDGKRGCDGRYRVLQGQKSQWLSCQLELQSFFSNDYALPWMTGSGLYKVTRAIWQRISPQRLSFPFLVASFGGMNKNAEYNQTYPQYAQEYSKGEWEFFKKITRKADGKNGFPKVSNDFGDEFSAGGINNCLHQTNDNIIEERCQAV